MRDVVSVPSILLAAGLVLLVAPALVPVQPVLFHETGPGTGANGSQLEEQGIRIVAYENLSDRGKELYRETLRNRGRHTVSVDQGAQDFDYSTGDDEDDDEGPRSRFARSGLVAIERPPNATLPPADEPVEMAEQRRRPPDGEGEAEQRPPDERGNETQNSTTPSVEEQRERIERYDLMITRKATPSLTASSNLVRLLAVMLGVLSLGVGGYFSSRP